jgi:phage repressor protein C with HTH and peptisase S24 domain
MSKYKASPIESSPSWQPNDARFQLRIVGDAMAPEYPHGSLVEFRIVDTERESLGLGLAYVVWHSSEPPTFKVFIGASDETMLFATLNQKKYPGFIQIPRREVSRIAEAVAIVLPRPKPRTPRIVRARRNHAVK